MPLTSNYDLLIDKIDTFIRRFYLNKLLRGCIFLGAAMFSGYILITISEYFANFNTLYRGILFYGYLLLIAGIFCWLILPPMLAYFKLKGTLTHDEAAAIIGTHFTDVKDKLLNTLQLKRLADENPDRRQLIEASIEQKITALKPVSFPSAIRIKENAKHLKWALVPLGVIMILAFAEPNILTESTARIIKHNQYFAPKSAFQITVVNPALFVVQGSDFKLDVKLSGDKFPDELYIQTGKNTFKLDKDNISCFHYIFTNVQQNIKFSIKGNDFVTAGYELKVNLKPGLLHFDVDLQYPAYLHKKNERLNNAGDLTIPEGTSVQWHIHTANTNAMDFTIDKQTHKLFQTDVNTFFYSQRLMQPANYTLKVNNSLVRNGDSASYHINVIADQPPTILVNEKRDSTSTKALYFNGKIQDDYGFTNLTFSYSVNSHNNQKPITVTKTVNADLQNIQADFFYYWDLKQLTAQPGDEITYYFEITDNDALIGGHKVRTSERTLKLPTEKEIGRQLDANGESVKQKMTSAIKLSGDVERDAQKLNKLLLDKNTLTFDEKKQIADLLQKRKELENLVSDIQKQNQQNNINREENRQQSQEILDKQKQIENLFNNVLDAKTRDLLTKLQKMLEQNLKEPAQDELAKMQMDSKSLQKELDRVLELYKQLEFDQKLNDNISQLNKLADKLNKLAGEAKKPNTDSKSIQQEQNQVTRDFNDVKKALDDLKQKNEELQQKNNFDDPKQDEQKIDEKLNQSSDNLEKNNKPKASENQKQASDEMEQLAQKLQKMQQQGEETANEVNVHQLRELIKNLVNSSFDQEKVMQTLKTTSTNDPAYITWAQKQQEIKDNMKNVEDSLYSLSKRVPQIESTVNTEVSAINTNIDQALAKLGDRRTNEANRNQQYAMTSMNNLALMLTDALENIQNSMKNGKGGKGKAKHPSLSQLGQMQQKLNENMQKMRDQLQQQGNKGQSRQGDGNMSEQLAKMAREQQMIRQTLQQINQEQNKDGRRGLGNLDNISKEMEQTEKDLVNRKILDATLQRQQQIKTRLLEAEKAEQEQEQDKQRDSKAGKDVPAGYIKALQDYQLMKNKQTEQIQTVSPTLNYYYKSKIKVYFDQINGK